MDEPPQGSTVGISSEAKNIDSVSEEVISKPVLNTGTESVEQDRSVDHLFGPDCEISSDDDIDYDDYDDDIVSEDEREEIKKKAEAHKQKGNELMKKCAYSAAGSEYTNAITLCQAHKNPEKIGTLHIYYCNRSLCAIKNEYYHMALQDAAKAIKLCPEYSKAYYRRGCAFACMGKYSRALKAFEAAHKLVPHKDTEEMIKVCSKEVMRSQFAEAISVGVSAPLHETIDPSIFEENLGTYSGPRYRRDAAFIKELIDYIKTPGNTLLRRDAYQIVLDIITLLKKGESLVYLTVEGSETLTVCGDIHGQFYDMLNIFDINGLPSEKNLYLFNGDIVDRGSFSVECILVLFAEKLLYPNHLHLARGNHETKDVTEIYGFKGEVTAKYDKTLYLLFCEAFCLLPLAHVINRKVFVVHGGLFEQDGVKLSDIERIDRNREPPSQGLMTDILWADPQPGLGRSPSKRGVSWAFGPDVTEAFLKDNSLDYVIRSHEMKDLGYAFEHDSKVITVFSAPNYCDRMQNKGAFLKLRGNDPSLKPEVVQFDAVPHPRVDVVYASPLSFSMLS